MESAATLLWQSPNALACEIVRILGVRSLGNRKPRELHTALAFVIGRARYTELRPSHANAVPGVCILCWKPISQFVTHSIGSRDVRITPAPSPPP